MNFYQSSSKIKFYSKTIGIYNFLFKKYIYKLNLKLIYIKCLKFIHE